MCTNAQKNGLDNMIKHIENTINNSMLVFLKNTLTLFAGSARLVMTKRNPIIAKPLKSGDAKPRVLSCCNKRQTDSRVAEGNVMKTKVLFSSFLLLCVLLSVPCGTEGMQPLKQQAFFMPYIFSFNVMMDTALDPRSDDNQVISCNQVLEELEMLFTASLYTLLVNSEIRSIAQSLQVLRRALNLAAHSMSRALPLVLQTVIDTITMTFRQLWEYMLIALTGFVALASLGRRMRAAPRGIPVVLPYTVSPCVLRC